MADRWEMKTRLNTTISVPLAEALEEAWEQERKKEWLLSKSVFVERVLRAALADFLE